MEPEPVKKYYREPRAGAQFLEVVGVESREPVKKGNGSPDYPCIEKENQRETVRFTTKVVIHIIFY